MPSLSPPPANLTRSDAARAAGAKRGAKLRRAGRSAAATVAAPLAAAGLVLLLLLYYSHAFAHVVGAAYEDRALVEIIGADPAAAAREREREAAARLLGGDGGDDGSDALLSQLASDEAQHGGGGGRRAGWLSAALLWAEEHHRQRLAARAGPHAAATGCGRLPCRGQQLVRPRTLVLYTYAAADAEQQANFAFFLQHGIEAQDWLWYRLIIASGAGVLPPVAQPALPPNAAYVHSAACTTGAWGIIAGAATELAAELAAAQHIVVVGSAARGPFLPPYARPFMHWTDAFTSKLTKRTKLVGAVVTCEGAPLGGDAAAEWRNNPFVQPYAWATDKEGWALMTADPQVLRCHPSPWEARYHSDAGAALALLSGGHNLDTLLAKYQGLDWWNSRTWGCNKRVSPDAEWTYDGVSVSPYETVFVPVSLGPAQAEWGFVRQAARYSEWLDAQAAGAPQGNSNSFEADLWGLRAQRVVAMNARGPGCFDFDYYVQANPELAPKAGMAQLLWEHWALLGQFQGRPHRFSCPLQLGTSYRSAYARARGRRCWDHDYYAAHNPDVQLAGVTEAYQLFNHYAEYGQFEARLSRYVCADLVHGLPAGFDSRPLTGFPVDPAAQNAAKWEGLVRGAAATAQTELAKLRATGGASAAAEAEVEAAERDAAAKAAQVAARGRVDVATAAAAAAAAMEAERQAALAAARAEQQQQQQQQQQLGTAVAAQQAAAAQQQQQAAAGGGAGGGTAADAQQQGQQQGAAQAAGGQQGQQAAAGQEAVGDAANAAAFGRLQAAEAEAFAAQQAAQAAAGGGDQAAP